MRKPKKTHREETWLLSYADLMTLLVAMLVLLLSFSTVDTKSFEVVKKSASEKFGGKYENPLEGIYETIDEVIVDSNLKGSVDVKIEGDHVRITFSNRLFFDTGSTQIFEASKTVLNRLINSLKAYKDTYKFRVEGHTDDVPMRNSDITNWELSGLRASRVVRQFVRQGFAADRFSVLALADTRPLVPNRDKYGNGIAENRAKNRRVVILVHRPEESLAK